MDVSCCVAFFSGAPGAGSCDDDNDGDEDEDEYADVEEDAEDVPL